MSTDPRWDPAPVDRLVARLERLGVGLDLVNGELVFGGAVESLTQRDWAQLRRRKLDLAAWVAGDRRTDIQRQENGHVLRAVWLPSMPEREREEVADGAGELDW